MQVVLGLGGNRGEPPIAFAAALEALASRHRVLAVSRLYRTRPVGPDQPPFWNAAARIRLGTSLMELLDLVQRLESQAGRRRELEVRWGPRPLDIDLLIGRGVVHTGRRLVLPHPELHRRAFALVPAAEVASGWLHPLLGRPLSDLAEAALASDLDSVRQAGDLPQVGDAGRS